MPWRWPDGPLAERRKAPIKGGSDGSACVAGGLVFIGGNDGRLYAFDAASGAVKWKVDGRGLVCGSPAAAYGTVFMEGPIAFDAATGTKRWGKRMASYADGRLSSLAVTGSGTGGGMGSLGGGGGALAALDLATLKPRWVRRTAARDVEGRREVLLASPAVWEGIVFTGTAHGSLHAFDARTGASKWRFATGGKIRSSPCPSDGVVYAGSDDGRVYAVE
jgi:outer membrane protein assembly factor BamB